MGTGSSARGPTATTLYLPGMELRLDQASGEVTAWRYYTHNDQTVALRTPDGVSFLADDHQDTGKLAIDAANQDLTQRRHTPFGAPRGTPTGLWPDDKGFVGGTLDPSTGLTHLGAREYDPATGRFLSVDPLMDVTDPQTWNGYAYAKNSPITHHDASGLRLSSSNPAPLCDWWPHHPSCGGGSSGGSSTGGSSGGGPVHVAKPQYPAGTVPIPARIDYREGRESQYAAAYARMAVEPRYYAHFHLAFCAEFPAHQRCTPPPTPSGPDVGHTILDTLGLVPVAGNAADATNVLWYAFEGDAVGASTSAAALLPVIGQAATGAKIAKPAAITARACRANSFVPGTKVLMADGTHKPIQDIEVGDPVLATDPQTGKTAARPVLAIIMGHGDKNLVEITVDTDGDKGDSAGVIVATAGHPFWVAGQQAWIDSGRLQAGMWLRTAAGTYVQIVALRLFTAQKDVYNLTVAGIHTYYVLAQEHDILAHNCPTRIKKNRVKQQREKLRQAREQKKANVSDSSEGATSPWDLEARTVQRNLIDEPTQREYNPGYRMPGERRWKAAIRRAAVNAEEELGF